MYCQYCGERAEICALERGEPLPEGADMALVRRWWETEATQVLPVLQPGEILTPNGDVWTPADQEAWERDMYWLHMDDDEEDAALRAWVEQPILMESVPVWRHGVLVELYQRPDGTRYTEQHPLGGDA